jgi:putative SOS response-associated peptidase YedK
MCGRFSLTSTPRRLREAFGLAADPDDLRPRYNIAPTDPVLVIPNRTTRVLRPARWGLIPHWANDPRIGPRLINLRDETLLTREGFRLALERRRCIVPADGFYEWRRDRRGRRTPYYFTRRDGAPLGLAGIWDVWSPAEGERVASCAIVTTDANALVAPIHDRMPVVLPPDAYEMWLSPTPSSLDELAPLLAPCPPDWLEVRQVSTHVNKPEHDDPSCIAPVEDEDTRANPKAQRSER